MDKTEFSKFYEMLLTEPKTKSTIDDITVKICEIKSIHSIEEKNMNNRLKDALRTKKEEDLIELSKQQGIFDKLTQSCETQIELLVVKIQEIENSIKDESCPANNTRSKKASSPFPLPLPLPLAVIIDISRPRVTFTALKAKFNGFITNLIEFYSKSRFDKEDFHLSKEIVEIKGKKITFETSDVRGDGACGFRAIISSYMNILHIQMSYDPLCMKNFILILKDCMYDLLLILNENSKNREFVACLLSNPGLGSKVANVSEWFEKIKQNGYYCTDGDIRLIAILFGMLPEQDKIEQINVLKLKPVEHNPYQSFNCYGTPEIVLPSNDSHINIIHTGCHYRSVTNIIGIIDPICSIDSVITLPK